MSMKQELSIIKRARCRRLANCLTVYDLTIGDVLGEESVAKRKTQSFPQTVNSFCNIMPIALRAPKKTLVNCWQSVICFPITGVDTIWSS